MNLLIHAKTIPGKFFLGFKLSISGCSIEVSHPKTRELHGGEGGGWGGENGSLVSFPQGRSHSLPEKVMLNPS